MSGEELYSMYQAELEKQFAPSIPWGQLEFAQMFAWNELAAKVCKR